MLPARLLSATTACCLGLAAPAQPPALIYTGSASVTSAADGGLRPAVGVHTIQVYRANRTAPAHQDGLNHTYLHAPMLAHWAGRFHLDYLSGPVSEHEPPCPTSYTSSVDGVNWEAPRVLFPSFQLKDGTPTLTHQRVSFFVAPNDRLLATAFHGRAPSPNDGTGIGRFVREIHRDGSFGPIHLLRLNRHAGWTAHDVPYPSYGDAKDPGFVAACEALLGDRLMTLQWWEEDQSDDGFYRVKGKAFSFVTRADGSVLAVAKDAQHAVSFDRGETWERRGFMGHVPVNSSKYWIQRTSDERYVLVFNPTARLRHPLALLTSRDGTHFDNLLSVHTELPDQRFPGFYKNMGPQYVRGILEGNGQPPGPGFWLTYSVNKEDIWVSHVPVPITAAVDQTLVEESFEGQEPGSLPVNWNIYRPLWAPVTIVDHPQDAGRVLQLADEDPYDYASATRVFRVGRSAQINFKLMVREAAERLEVDVVGAQGERPVQVAFLPDGRIEARHEGIWKPAGEYIAGEWTAIEIDVNPGRNVDRFQFRVNGKEVLRRIAYFSELVPAVERLTFRTGEYRRRGSGGHELPGSDQRTARSTFLIDDVRIETRDSKD